MGLAGQPVVLQLADLAVAPGGGHLVLRGRLAALGRTLGPIPEVLEVHRRNPPARPAARGGAVAWASGCVHDRGCRKARSPAPARMVASAGGPCKRRGSGARVIQESIFAGSIGSNPGPFRVPLALSVPGGSGHWQSHWHPRRGDFRTWNDPWSGAAGAQPTVLGRDGRQVGRWIANRVPSPTALSTSIRPPWSAMIPWPMLRPEARPAADRLGREEGVEDLRQDVRRDAAAVVGDLDDDLAASADRVDEPDLARAPAGRLDRLEGVHQEVQEELIERAPRRTPAGAVARSRVRRSTRCCVERRRRACRGCGRAPG